MFKLIFEGLFGTSSATVFTILISVLFLFSCLFLLAFPNKRQWIIGKAPSLLTTLGLFGTFYGVAIGLGEFDVSNIDRSVIHLISGMKLAFWTSILGMLCAFLLHVSQYILGCFYEEEEEEKDIIDVIDIILQALQDNKQDNSLIEEIRKFREVSIHKLSLKKQHELENPWASVSDMMSGLMIIFLFISVAYMNSVTKEKEKIEEIAIMWDKTQENLYLDLEREFRDDLPKWKASLNRENLSIRFAEPSVFFDPGSAVITQGFQSILNDFFPRYINILRKYQSNIVEVRIEGHTSSEWMGAKDSLDAYFRNMQLSQERTRAVLQYCLMLPSISSHLHWAIKTITANGLSSSKTVLDINGQESPALSRRVEFRVRTDAEKRVITILEKIK